MSSPVSGFTAIPNPMMLSYMGTQSFIMMYEAGSAWQFGKRKISAMTNEDFNKMSPLDLINEHNSLLKGLVDKGIVQKGMSDMSPLITTMMEQFGEYIQKAIAAFPSAAQSAVANPETGRPYGAELGDYLKSLIPGLPPAEARLGPGISKEAITLVGQQNTYQQRLAKHKATIAEANRLRELQKLSANTIQKIPSVHEIALRAQRDTFLRKAGQTQIMQRKKLIEIIRVAGIRVKKWSLLNAQQKTSRTRNYLNQYSTEMNKAQVQLRGLIQRYRF